MHMSRSLEDMIDNKLGLQYAQDFSGGELQAWMTKWHGY